MVLPSVTIVDSTATVEMALPDAPDAPPEPPAVPVAEPVAPRAEVAANAVEEEPAAVKSN